MGKYTEDLATRFAMNSIGQARLEAEYADFQEKIGPWTTEHSLHVVNEAQMTRADDNVHTFELQLSNLALYIEVDGVARPDRAYQYLTNMFNTESNYQFIKVKFIPEIPALELP